MELSVILATYNRGATLREALASLDRLSTPPNFPWELILVDNNSDDDTRQVVNEFARNCSINVHYLFEPTQGKSSALNTGIRNAGGKIIAFTDDDVIVDPRWLTELAAAFDKSDCLAVAGRVVPVWSEPQPDWLELEDQQAVVHFEYGDEPHEIDIPPIGANMAFRRQIFEKYGLFRLALSSYKRRSGGTEDMEFGLRLLRAGEKLIYIPTAVIYHPVDRNRPTKKFMLRWAYRVGEKMSRARLWPPETVTYLGVPRYLFRSAVESAVRWATTLDAKRRFRYKLRTFRLAGEIREALRAQDSEISEVPRLGPSSDRGTRSPNVSCLASESPLRKTVENDE